MLADMPVQASLTRMQPLFQMIQGSGILPMVLKTQEVHLPVQVKVNTLLFLTWQGCYIITKTGISWQLVYKEEYKFCVIVSPP